MVSSPIKFQSTIPSGKRYTTACRQPGPYAYHATASRPQRPDPPSTSGRLSPQAVGLSASLGPGPGPATTTRSTTTTAAATSSSSSSSSQSLPSRTLARPSPVVGPAGATSLPLRHGLPGFSPAAPAAAITLPSRRRLSPVAPTSTSLPPRHSLPMADLVESDHPVSRKRVPMACTRCRQRKIRCSGNKGDGKPCQSCHNNSNSNCVFNRVHSIEAPWRSETDPLYAANAGYPTPGFDYPLGPHAAARALATRSSPVMANAFADVAAPQPVDGLLSSYRGTYPGQQGSAYPQGYAAYPHQPAAYYSPYPHGYEYNMSHPVGPDQTSWSSRRPAAAAYGAQVAGDVYAVGDMHHAAYATPQTMPSATLMPLPPPVRDLYPAHSAPPRDPQPSGFRYLQGASSMAPSASSSAPPPAPR